jgi:hypothetical protein
VNGTSTGASPRGGRFVAASFFKAKAKASLILHGPMSLMIPDALP